MSSVGTYLRELRQRKGVSLEEIARTTRVAQRYLESLEAEAFDALPSPVFTRGFIRAYCQALSEPPDEALAAYEGREITATPAPGARPGTPTSRPIVPAGRPSSAAASRTSPASRSAETEPRGRGAVLVSFVLLVVLGVALFAVALLIHPRDRGERVAVSEPRSESRPVRAPSGEPVVSVPRPTTQAAPPPTGATAAPGAPVLPGAAAPAAPRPAQPGAAVPAAPAAPAPAAPAPAAPATPSVPSATAPRPPSPGAPAPTAAAPTPVASAIPGAPAPAAPRPTPPPAAAPLAPGASVTPGASVAPGIPPVAAARPVPPTPAAAPPSAPAPPALDAVVGSVSSPYRLVARTNETTWIRVRTEDGRMSEENVPPGEVREWISNRPFVLSIGNAGGVSFELNGRSLPSLGPKGAVIQRIVLPPEAR